MLSAVAFFNTSSYWCRDCDSVTYMFPWTVSLHAPCFSALYTSEHPYMHLVSLLCLPVSSIPTSLSFFLKVFHLVSILFFHIYTSYSVSDTHISCNSVLSCLEKSRCSMLRLVQKFYNAHVRSSTCMTLKRCGLFSKGLHGSLHV